METNLDNLEVLFQRKRYPVIDFQAPEPEVGIMSGYFTFCLTTDEDDEGLTIDMPSGRKNERLNVYDNNGKIMGKGKLLVKNNA